MPKLDFFAKQYVTEPPRTETSFGIIDDGSLSRTTIEGDSAQWDAIVTNVRQLTVHFVPVDHNIEVRRPNGDLESLCDAMLWRDGWVCFVEIKDRHESWISEAVEQLKSTIAVFKASHDWNGYGKREAYACNRRHGRFKASKMQEMNDFRRETGFRLNIVNTITAR